MRIGQEINDGEVIWKVAKFFEEDIYSVIGIRRSGRAYNVGDRMRILEYPSILLECIEAGTSSSIYDIVFEPEEGEENYTIPIGTIIEDGTVKWLILDITDGTPVGGFRFSLYVPPGYIVANGSTVNRTDYPRLTKMITDNNLWTDSPGSNPGLFGIGDGETTMVLPDLRNKYVKYVETEAGKGLTAGLPNITGTIVNTYGNFSNATGMASTVTSATVGGNAAITVTSGSTFNVDISDATGYSTINLKASDSNSIYGSSTTVQPPAVTMLPIIRY